MISIYVNVHEGVFYSNHEGTDGNNENSVNNGNHVFIMPTIIKKFYDSKKEFMIMTS